TGVLPRNLGRTSRKATDRTGDDGRTARLLARVRKRAHGRRRPNDPAGGRRRTDRLREAGRIHGGVRSRREGQSEVDDPGPAAETLALVSVGWLVFTEPWGRPWRMSAVAAVGRRSADRRAAGGCAPFLPRWPCSSSWWWAA